MLRIGTAGFAYKDWDGPVYPKPRPLGFDPLRFVASYFDTVEMNTTFYGVPKLSTVKKWIETVADRPAFRFTFKLYKGLTHAHEDDTLPPFLEALEPCRAAGRLGAVLLQFPHTFANTQANRARLSFLAGRLAGWPCAVELRDRAWTADAALDFLRRLGLSFCNIDICATETAVPPGSWTTGPLGYVRLHGRNTGAWFDANATVNEKYDYLYAPGELRPWADLVREIAAETDSTYVITNNHFGGKAMANAFQLARMLLDDAPPPPPTLQRAFPELA